jgi:hypothetical protein
MVNTHIDKDDLDLAIALRNLASNEAAKSETARLRAVWPEVEAAFASGVKQDAMLDLLHKKGFTMTKASFKSVIQRLRKEMKNA